MKYIEELLITIFTSPLFQCMLIAWGVVLGVGIGLIIVLCLAAIVMDVIALIVGESENG